MIEVKALQQDQGGILSFSCAENWGGSGITLEAQIHGKKVTIFPPQNLPELESQIKVDPRVIFQKLASPLFPLANRLRGLLSNKSTIKATLESIEVTAAANIETKEPGSERLHLHGVLYKKTATRSKVNPAGNSVTLTFQNCFENEWASQAEVRQTHAIENGAYIFTMTAKNTGTANMPVGFGAHPYFLIPNPDPAQMRLQIPSHQVAEIDSLKNVFPTGKILNIKGTHHDFSTGAVLPASGLDHFFFLADAKVIKLHDVENNICFKITGLTANIIGVQIYYPANGQVIAIEPVTHVPDPRHEIWGSKKTGLTILAPDEETTYSYKIEVISDN